MRTMDKKLIWIYIWIIIVFIYTGTKLYEYKYWAYTENEKLALKKKLDVVRLPKIIYEEKTVDKLFNSISLKNEYNNNK